MKFPDSPRYWLWLALLLLPLTVSNDSLWLDEGDTAMYAIQPDFFAWCHRLMHDGQADCQMPLGMLCSWIGAKLLGIQEWQLRAINLLWGALALMGMSRIGRRLQIPWLPLLLAIQPYFWFYLNEARPYALQIAGGAWLLCALIEFISSRAAGTGWAWQFALTGFFLFCATLLAPLPLVATILAGGFLAWRHGWRPESKAIKILLGGLIASLPLGFYYLTTLLRGVRGMQMWQVDLKFVAYVFYELTGMGGLGLSGAEIRSFAHSPHLAHELVSRFPQLIFPLLLGIILLLVILAGLRGHWQTGSQPLLAGILMVPAVTAGIFIVGSLVLQKAFWARHYAPMFPFYVTLMGLAFASLRRRLRKSWWLLPVAICGLLAGAALSFRFAPKLRKEDYRSATAAAKSMLAHGQSVWWLAGDYSALYYGLPLAYETPEAGRAFAAPHSHRDCRDFPLPDAIVLSKPDIHDPCGTVGKILAENHYKTNASYQGFQVWVKSEKQH